MLSSPLINQIPHKWLSLFVIIGTGAILLAILTPHDYQWTLYFSTHDLARFTNFFNRSVFNGDSSVGAGDFVYPLLLITLILYCVSWLRTNADGLPRSRFSTFLSVARPLLGFVLTSAFSCALLFVHTVKQVVGRARPNSVFDGKMTFSAWYQNGEHFFTHGSYTGSLPSGHTATASISIIFVYVLLAYLKGRRRIVGWVALLLAILFTVAMGISRMMSASHWLTDVTFTLFAEWALIHVFFYWVLNVPEQQDYFQKHGRLQPHRKMFELQLCLYLLLTSLGVWSFFTGLRSYWFEGWSWLLMLTPVGLAWTLFFLRMARNTLELHPNQLGSGFQGN